jgi:hypothetical protein
MELRAPFVITSRLLPGVRFTDANESISIEFGRETSDGRIRYKYYIDTPDFSYENDDLKSGVGGGSLQQGMLSVLSFLGAAAEAFRHGPESDNFDLFPKHVMEWVYQNADEISVLQMEIQEGGELISENPKIRRPKFTTGEIEGGDYGVCLACGEVADGVEPYARKYKCDACGERQVYGLQEAALMGKIDIADPEEPPPGGFGFPIISDEDPTPEELKTEEDRKLAHRHKSTGGHNPMEPGGEKGIVARWESRSGKHFVELYEDSYGFWYKHGPTGRGIGSLGQISREQAIAEMEKRLEWLTPDNLKTGLKRTMNPSSNPLVEEGYADGGAPYEGEGLIEEGDITTEDHHHWYQYGKLYVTGDVQDVINAMKKDNFYPNVWFISDHGNVIPVDMSSAMRETERQRDVRMKLKPYRRKK